MSKIVPHLRYSEKAEEVAACGVFGTLATIHIRRTRFLNVVRR